MSSRPWYAFFPADYLADTIDLNLEEDGLYRRLLDLLWIHGPLPADDRILASLTRTHLRKFRRSFTKVSPKLRQLNGVIDHPKLAKQREELVEIQAKRAEAGRLGGLAKAKQSRARTTPTPISKRARYGLNGSDNVDQLPPSFNGGSQPESRPPVASQQRARSGEIDS